MGVKVSGNSSDRSIADMSFKEASIELEQVVRALEGGELELEDSLSYYTRGVELLKSLRERLAAAEQKVTVLMDDAAEGEPLAQDSSAAPSTGFLDD
ncbi:exodeoxyribonuclease VII small subunit [Olsenella sp. HMSC062G07]|nr:exodeoxyribonuclease VII small subunit [Olsenella sp. HMSC062G07]